MSSTWFVVTVTDNCSDPLLDSVYIKVFDPFNLYPINGPEVCFGEETFVELDLDSTLYDINWQTTPIVRGPRYTGFPGSYAVEVLEKSTGCKQRASIDLPGAKPIAANFTMTPNQPCIDIVNNTIEIIDLGFGYTDGTIDFGDGSPPVDLTGPGPIQHQYVDTGSFEITMKVINALGCEDEFKRIICIKNVVKIYIPDIFSPNGDGKSDFLKLSILELTYYVGQFMTDSVPGCLKPAPEMIAGMAVSAANKWYPVCMS